MGRILKRHIILPLCIIGIFILHGCTSECFENRNSIGLAGFYSMATKAAISIDSISIYGIGAPGDSMILKNAKGVKQVYLPMRVNASQTQYVFHYDQVAISDPRLNDTLTLNYEAIPYFASYDCGAMYWYKIEEFLYTRHIIDSIAIPSMMITNVDIETIEIFIRTSTAEDDE